MKDRHLTPQPPLHAAQWRGGFKSRAVCILLLLSACIPARTPVQLEYTPGPAVQVMDSTYDAGTFEVAYPDGWRVVTSAAGDPIRVIFVAPENDALIMVGEGLTEAPAPAGYTGELSSERREITLDDGTVIVAILNAPPENWDARLALFERMVESIR
jgi:hypothetical protein